MNTGMTKPFPALDARNQIPERGEDAACCAVYSETWPAPCSTAKNSISSGIVGFILVNVVAAQGERLAGESFSMPRVSGEFEFPCVLE